MDFPRKNAFPDEKDFQQKIYFFKKKISREREKMDILREKIHFPR